MIPAMSVDGSRRVDVICIATRGGGARSDTTGSCLSVSLVNGARDGGSRVVSPFSMVMMAGGGAKWVCLAPTCWYLIGRAGIARLILQPQVLVVMDVKRGGLNKFINFFKQAGVWDCLPIFLATVSKMRTPFLDECGLFLVLLRFGRELLGKPLLSPIKPKKNLRLNIKP
uniref:Uncharacterized protein n=1 Tax=Oryza meridionalis TaxID=40149 RepID=A0A0E0CZN8_9ORYZ